MRAKLRLIPRYLWLSGCGLMQVLLLLASSAEAAVESKLALVLGGGGARGGAHIGVLKQLERYNIVPDIVVGTSVGSLIGGLYAVGYSADEIESIITKAELETMFRQFPARDKLSFRRKKDDGDSLVKLRLRFVDGSVFLPDSLVPPHEFKQWLSREFSQYTDSKRGSGADIQYAAVATDLVTGKEVVLTEGDIEERIYASMSVPGLTPPVSRNEMLLVDGGLVNNLPISVAKGMGATHVIAVDVGTPFYKHDEITNSIQSVDQVARLLVHGNSEQAIADAAQNKQIIVLKPSLNGIATTAFKDIELAIEEGELAARSMHSQLERFQVIFARNDQSAKDEQRAPSIVNSIRFSTTASLNDYYLRSHFETRQGVGFDRNVLNTDLQRLYGTGLFSEIKSDVDGLDGQAVNIEIEAIEAKGRSFLQAGLTVEADSLGGSEHGLRLAFTKTPANRLGGEWRTHLNLERDLSIDTEFYQPFGSRMAYFGSVKSTYTRLNLGDDSESGLATAKILEGRAGRVFGNSGVGSLGFLQAKVDFKQFMLGVEEIQLRLERDTLDDPAFPASGERLSFVSNWRRSTIEGGSTSSTSYNLDGAKFFSSGARSTVALWATLGCVCSGTSLIEPYSAGGFLNLSGLPSDSLSGTRLFIARSLFYRRSSEGGFRNIFSIPLYTGGSLEYGRVWKSGDKFFFSDGVLSGSIYVGANTALGPLFLGVGLADTGGLSVTFSLGKPFVYQLTSSNFGISTD